MAKKAFPGLPKFASKPRRPVDPRTIRTGRKVKLKLPRTPNYMRIKEEVEAAIARLSTDKQQQIPMGTLPERMVALALVELGWQFQSQASEGGGRLFVGGSVVDFKVWIGTSVVVVRVQGDYWHSLPQRVAKDIVQWMRLHAQGFRVADLWEHDLYQAWIEKRLKQFVESSVTGAA